MRRWNPSSRTPVAMLLAGVLAACGPSNDDPGGGGGPDARPGSNAPDAGNGQCQGAQCLNACPAGTQTTITGVATMPNGIDPVPTALVYYPREVTEFPGVVQCEICDQISDIAVVSAPTSTDGTFTLGPIPTSENQSPGVTVPIVTQKGRFRKLSMVPIDNPCGANAISDEHFRLPGKNDGYNNIPNIAVATGDYDVIECVLLKIGLEQGAFDLYGGLFLDDGTPTQGGLDTLLSDLDRMKSYNMIFINCANNTHEDVLSNATVRSNIEQYVLSGGRLYVTDWSYDYIEQIPGFSPLIDFGPGASGASPEPMNEAAIGSGGIEVDALVHDQGLAEWLIAVEARTGEQLISGDNRVHVSHFLLDWVMQLSVAMMDNVKVWLTGNVSGTGLSGDLPLTTTFDYMQCGRVLYSSYHTRGRESGFPFGIGGFPGYCALSEPLSPQERVLEYLILHIADCIIIE